MVDDAATADVRVAIRVLSGFDLEDVNGRRQAVACPPRDNEAFPARRKQEEQDPATPEKPKKPDSQWPPGLKKSDGKQEGEHAE
jgi:hypothetical protein